MRPTGEALGEQRRLVFENVATGVPIPDVMAAFSLSELEVKQDVAFVARKISEYRFRRHQPPLPCETEFDIRFHRRPLLDTLRRLGPKSLSSEFVMPKVGIQTIKTPQELKQAARQARAFEGT